MAITKNKDQRREKKICINKFKKKKEKERPLTSFLEDTQKGCTNVIVWIALTMIELSFPFFLGVEAHGDLVTFTHKFSTQSPSPFQHQPRG